MQGQETEATTMKPKAFAFKTPREKVVSITPIAELFDNITVELIKELASEPHLCHHNAFANVLDNRNLTIEYVEGYVTHNGRTFAHCWNRCNGKYFDSTLENVCPSIWKEAIYQPTRIYDRDTIIEIVETLHCTFITFQGTPKRKYLYRIDDNFRLIKEPWNQY